MNDKQYNSQFKQGDIGCDYDDGVTYLLDCTRSGDWYVIILNGGDSGRFAGSRINLEKDDFMYLNFAQDIIANIYQNTN